MSRCHPFTGPARIQIRLANYDTNREEMMLIKDKVAVIYVAGGAIGGAVARAFAREGARLFLTGHHLAPVEAVCREVNYDGGSAEAAEVDALAEQAIDRHL